MNRKEIAKNILDNLPKHTKSILNIAPRFGKTKLMIDYIKKHKFKSVLWVTPSRELCINGIPNEFVKWKAVKYLNCLTTITWASLPKIKGKFDLVILDELQSITERNSSSLFNGITYDSIIGMTGTLPKNHDKTNICDRLGLKLHYNLSTKEAVNNEILSDYMINVVYINMSTEKDIKLFSKKLNKIYYTSEQKRYETLANYYEFAKTQGAFKAKMSAINLIRFINNTKSKFDVAKKIFDESEGRTIIFTPNIDTCVRMSDNHYFNSSKKTHFDNFQNGIIDKIAMVNKGGVGNTYSNINNIIIMQCDSDRTGLTSQKICRGLLKENDKVCNIWLLCMKNTVDEKYVDRVISSFDNAKINKIVW